MDKNFKPSAVPAPESSVQTAMTGPLDLPVHYLHRTPSPMFGIIALMLTLTLLALGTSVIQNADDEAFLSISATSTGTDGIPILRITDTTWAIDDQPIHESDMPFRLSTLSAHSQAIVIEHDPALTAERLTQVLETVNNAGFGQVGIRRADIPKD